MSNMSASLCRISASASCSAGSRVGGAAVAEGSVVIEVVGEESSEVMVEESV